MQLSHAIETSIPVASKGIITAQQKFEDAAKARTDGQAQEKIAANQETGIVPVANQGSEGSVSPVAHVIQIAKTRITEAELQVIVQALRETDNSVGTFLDVYA